MIHQHVRQLALVIASFLALAPTYMGKQSRAEEIEIVGTWSLVSMSRLNESGKTEPMGLGWDEAQGYIIYTAEGRMMVFLGAAGREAIGYPKLTDTGRALAHKTMASYTGTYEFQGDHIVHHVDMAWSPDWQGTSRRRKVEVLGDTIVLSTPFDETRNGRIASYRLVWKRVPLP